MSEESDFQTPEGQRESSTLGSWIQSHGKWVGLCAAALLLLGSALTVFPRPSADASDPSLAAIKPEGLPQFPSSYSQELNSSLGRLSKENLQSLGVEGIAAEASSLADAAAAMRKDPSKALKAAFPSTSEILAMISRDRDVDDFKENAAEENASGEYYREVVAAVPEMRDLRPSYAALFAAAYASLTRLDRVQNPQDYFAEASDYRSGITLPGLSTRPREAEYGLSHTFALDIFLKDVESSPINGLQKGPMIFSIEAGVVIAAENSWKGGETIESYHSGGITPKAGNGVIVYSPSSGRFYCYYHLHDAIVSKGMAIPEGMPLGHSGNTGTNARKKGHGEHLHLEIFDTRAGRFLRNTEIVKIVFG